MVTQNDCKPARYVVFESCCGNLANELAKALHVLHGLRFESVPHAYIVSHTTPIFYRYDVVLMASEPVENLDRIKREANWYAIGWYGCREYQRRDSRAGGG